MFGLVSQKRYNELLARHDELRELNSQILPMSRNGAANLVEAVGELEFLGPNDSDTALVYQAVDGLSRITMFPASRTIVVSDPRQSDPDEAERTKSVPGVVVKTNRSAILDGYALKVIQGFREAVLFSKHNGVRATGPVSTIRRPSSE